jgi:hypothetical protein
VECGTAWFVQTLYEIGLLTFYLSTTARKENRRMTLTASLSRRIFTVKRVFIVLLSVIVMFMIYLALFPSGQQPDRSFNAAVLSPTYVDQHPIILFDQGHNNAHSVSHGYAPFAELMQNDGYKVETNGEVFTSERLSNTNILVIVNADGGTNPKVFGINLVPLRKGVRGSPAFTRREVETIRDWVQRGGSLLLVADHAPFGSASAELASAFGVTMHKGFTEVNNQYPDQIDPSIIEFSTENGLLSGHAIIFGKAEDERIHKLRSFTGQSLDGPPGSTLLRLPPSAIEAMPMSPEEAARNTTPPPAGSAQAVAFEYGRGRIVVLGEAAMITAQVGERGDKFGMNVEGIDNRQFALNIMHWLSRAY